MSIRLTAPGLLPTCHSSSHIRTIIFDIWCCCTYTTLQLCCIFWWHLSLFGRDTDNFQSRRDRMLDSHTAQSWSVSTWFLIDSLWIAGGIVLIQLPKEQSLTWSVSFLLHSSSPYNLTYIYPQHIFSSSHHYPWQGFPWLLIKRSRIVVLWLFLWSCPHDQPRVNNLLRNTLASSFIEFISSLLFLRLNYRLYKFSDQDACLDRGVMSWIISIYFLLPWLTPFAYHPD